MFDRTGLDIAQGIYESFLKNVDLVWIFFSIKINQKFPLAEICY